jgi:peptidoglycan/xylan/chitin deacetylase (PgdA/CDA1 family)
MKTEKKELYLTFDDGPVPGPTEFALDILCKNSVTATFFCIGDNIRKHPDIFKNVTEGGHTIANHSVNHLDGWKASTEKYLLNIREFRDVLAAAGYHQKVNLFRPPYGRITGSQIKALPEYEIIMWDVLSKDYSKNTSPERCLQSTLKACRPGSIIVFHDSYKAEKNMRYALPRLIDGCLQKGYHFKSL